MIITVINSQNIFSELHQSIDKKEKVWYFACTMKKGILQNEEYPIINNKRRDFND